MDRASAREGWGNNRSGESLLIDGWNYDFERVV